MTWPPLSAVTYLDLWCNEFQPEETFYAAMTYDFCVPIFFGSWTSFSLQSSQQNCWSICLPTGFSHSLPTAGKKFADDLISTCTWMHSRDSLPMSLHLWKSVACVFIQRIVFGWVYWDWFPACRHLFDFVIICLALIALGPINMPIKVLRVVACESSCFLEPVSGNVVHVVHHCTSPLGWVVVCTGAAAGVGTARKMQITSGRLIIFEWLLGGAWTVRGCLCSTFREPIFCKFCCIAVPLVSPSPRN